MQTLEECEKHRRKADRPKLRRYRLKDPANVVNPVKSATRVLTHARTGTAHHVGNGFVHGRRYVIAAFASRESAQNSSLGVAACWLDQRIEEMVPVDPIDTERGRQGDKERGEGWVGKDEPQAPAMADAAAPKQAPTPGEGEVWPEPNRQLPGGNWDGPMITQLARGYSAGDRRACLFP